MLTLLFSVVFALLVSSACSLAETALYSVPWAYIDRLRRQGRTAGKLLFEMRSHVDRPIAAILTLNTIANTAGSAVAGAAFMAVFGAEYMAVFAGVFTVLVLVLGEIVPKTLGVAHAGPVAAGLARPLSCMVSLLTPITWLTSLLTRVLTPASSGPKLSEDDIRAVASLSREAGAIQGFEERLIRHTLTLDQRRVHDIMTPRTVVFSLPRTMRVAEASRLPELWHFSRIPVYGDDREDIVGLLERRAIGQALARGDRHVHLGDIMKPMHFVLENMTLDTLLLKFLDSRTHLMAVLDEYGGLSGVVSLEDVLEELLGREIVDESDSVVDLQALARRRQRTARHSKNV